MLELIVLGRIPGTQFEITYWWSLVLLAALFIGLEVLVRHENNRDHSQKQIPSAEEIAI